MKFEYKTVDTSTLKGLKEAEKLHASGWKVIRTGLYLIQFERVKCITNTKK
jgi:hypothetical protein